VYYFHQDQLGSTRLLTDTTGATAATYTFDAYGNVIAKTGAVSTPLGIAGQYTDAESGLKGAETSIHDAAAT
jgi:YD repeat-containing protein